MDGVLSSSEEVFRALKAIPALGNSSFANPFQMNHLPAPNPALGDFFGLNASPERKMKQCAELSMDAPAHKDAPEEDLTPNSEDTEAMAKSKLERRREQNREAQRRFRQRARQDTEKDAKAPAACAQQPMDMSFLGKRIRDGPSSFPVALPKVDAKVQPAPNVMGLLLSHLAQSTPAAPMGCAPQMGAAPVLPVNDIQMQLNLLKMQQMANNISAPVCAGAPAAQDELAATAGETEQEKDLKKMKRRVQNREAQRRHRMRLKTGEPDEKSDEPKGQSSSLNDFLSSSVDSIHVPSPAQLSMPSQANNTQNLLQMLSMRMPALGGSAPMAGLSI